MAGSHRRTLGTLACGAVVCACTSLLPSCGLILGLDEGIAIVGDDASAQDANPVPEEPDRFVAAPSGSDATTIPEVSPPETSTPAMADGCMPDPGWCDSHCGEGPDNCGEARQCPANCPQGYVCNAQNTCECQTEAAWCTGRCGNTTDNCDNPIDCGTCSAEAGSCQPEAVATACGGRQCGQTTNNCGQLVNCGLLGLGLCAGLLQGQVCLASGECCTPESASACGNQCGTFATDNCGERVQCPSSCGSGQVCYQNSCCTPADACGGACGVTRVDNCGQTIQCGCSGAQECSAQTSTCCTPQGCSANCIDSCGLRSNSCCNDAGPPEAGAPEAGAPEAGALEAGEDDAETEADPPDGGAPLATSP